MTPVGPFAPVPVTPSRLWQRMTREQREQAALALWRDEQAADDHVQAALLIAQQKKFRPKTIMALDDDRKARHLSSLSSLPDSLAARVLVAYHLAAQRPMMAAFLDALGIAHENGLIEQDGIVPQADKLAPAAAAIAERFPAADVSLYLNTLVCQDPDTWAGLRELPQLQS
jgi:hypothetical protein